MEAKRSAASGHSSTALLLKIIARVLSFIFTLKSLITLAPVIAANTIKHDADSGLISYRYTLSSNILGLIYTLFQIAVSIYNLSRGTGDRKLVPLDFYGDLVILYALVTGAVAGFGATSDLKRMVDVEGAGLLAEKGNAAATFLLVGSLFSAVSLMISTHDLRSRRYFRRYKDES